MENWPKRNFCSRRGSAGSLEPVRITKVIRFAEGFELDADSYTLRRGGRALRLEVLNREAKSINFSKCPASTILPDQRELFFPTGEF